MTSYTSSCYPIAVQSVRDAILKDSLGETKEAFCNYISCMLFMLQALKNEAWEKKEISEVCTEETTKLVKLTDQCLGRIKDIFASNAATTNVSSNQSTSPSTSPNLRVKKIAGRRVSEPPNLHYPSANNGTSNTLTHAHRLLDTLPSPPGVRRASASNYQHRNQEMFQAYQRRKTLKGLSSINAKYNTANYNLNLFRREAEKKALTLAKEKVIQKRWVERQSEIKIEAEKRYGLRNNRSQRDKEYRQNLLAEIMAFEEQTNWPVAYRNSLIKNSSDIQAIINVVQAVLRCKDHPLCKVCKGLQYVVYQKTLEILNENENDDYLTPVNRLQRQTPKLPLSAHVQSTGRRDKSYSFCGDELPVDRLPAPISQDDERKLDSNNTNSVKTTEGHDFKERDNQDSNDGIDGKNHNAMTMRQKYGTEKSNSFDKLYDDLEDAIFSSDSDDGDEADDEAELTTDNSPEPKDLEKDKNESEHKEIKRHSPSTMKMNNENLTSGKDNKCSNMSVDQPKDDKIQSTEGMSTQDNVEGKQITTQVQSPIYDTPENMVQTGEPSQSTNIYDAPYEENKDPPVSIEVHSPNTPREAVDGPHPPLPQRYSTEGEYSDVSEEFKGDDDYEGLTTTKKEEGTSSPSTRSSIKSPEYFAIDSDGQASMSTGDYEDLNFNASEENIYEELDTLGKDGEDKVEKKDDIEQGCSFEEQNPNDRFPIDTLFLKKLDGIIQEIRFGIDRLHSVLLLSYEDLDTPVGRDQSYATLESILFQPLWLWIIQVFRIMNKAKEEKLKELMDFYDDCSPKELKIRDKFTLLEDNEPLKVPYEEAINEIKLIGNLKCPLDKLECLVRMSKAICHCVEVFWLNKNANEKTPSVGCDDLLPIVSFVLMKTKDPRIVSECHAMEEFIHEGYLMGEEGYCLTTLHAALSHLLTLPTTKK